MTAVGYVNAAGMSETRPPIYIIRAYTRWENHLIFRWRFGAAATAWDASTKLLYVEPG